MGMRANYVLVEEGGWSLRYSHWAAVTVDRDMFWGPDHAVAFIRAQAETDQWLDDVWAEGGALVDTLERVVLWFGGEDIAYSALRARLHLAMMRRLWPGWSVHWASNGVHDLVDHLGLPRTLVTAAVPPRAPAPFQSRGRRIRTALTVRPAPGAPVRVYPWSVQAPEVFAAVAPDAAELGPGAATGTFALHGDDSLEGGVHLDVASRHATVWRCNADPPRPPWPGWTATHHGHDFEVQLALADGALTFTTPPLADVMAELVRYLLDQSSIDPAAMLRSILASRPGHDVQVNPAFFEHTHHEFEAAERYQRLTQATAGLATPW